MNNIDIIKKLLSEAIDLQESKKLFLAELKYKEILKLNKDNFATNKNLGILYTQLGSFHEANKFLQIAEDIEQLDIEVKYLLGRNFIRINDYSSSLKKFLAIKNKINNYKYDHLIGLNYYKLNNLKECLKIFDNLINLKKITTEGVLIYSQILFELKKFDLSLLNIEKIIKENPTISELRYHKTKILTELRFYDAAEKELNYLIEIDNYKFEYNKDLFLLFKIKKNYKDAINLCDKNIQKKKKGFEYFFFQKCNLKISLCDWEEYEENIKNYTKILKRDKNYFDISPINLKLFCDDSDLECGLVKKITDNIFKNYNTIDDYKFKKNKKIKIGFFTSDIADHPVYYVLENFIKNYNKSEFELYVFSNIENENEKKKYVEGKVNNYTNIFHLNHEECSKKILSFNLDFLFDINGFTDGARTALFKNKIAKKKINWLGYPGTMGSDCYDYIIADKEVIGNNESNFLEKKIIYQEPCFFPIVKKNDFSNTSEKKNFGLPLDKFLLAAPHRANKITPSIFNTWLKLLKNNKNIKLLLGPFSDEVKTNLTKHIIKQDLDIKDIIFLERLDKRNDYIARLELFDIILDSFPYGSHSTAAEALFIGKIPVITLRGNSFQSRVGSSLLKSVGLEKLVTQNLKQYFETADFYIKNPNELIKLKKNLINIDINKKSKDYIDNFQNLLKKIHK